jgi:hypothetical protein
MDERLEKAFQTANYMASLSNLRRVILEEFNQSLVYYTQGATFTIHQELISFVKVLIDVGNTESIILDDNNIPVNITNLQEFLTKILNIYAEATNDYLSKYADLKIKRKVEALVEL